MTYFLKTKRIGFRNWKKDDFHFAKQLWGDHKVTKLIDTRSPLTDEQVMSRLLEEIDRAEKYGVQYFPIFLIESHEHIGCCGLRPYDLDNRIFEIGFHIKSNHWRKGCAHEAAQAMIQYAFEKLNAQQLFAGHNPKNEASKKLLLKLGFEYVRDEFYEPTGLMHPSYVVGRFISR